jgi:hypothetical protein
LILAVPASKVRISLLGRYLLSAQMKRAITTNSEGKAKGLKKALFALIVDCSRIVYRAETGCDLDGASRETAG